MQSLTAFEAASRLPIFDEALPFLGLNRPLPYSRLYSARRTGSRPLVNVSNQLVDQGGCGALNVIVKVLYFE